MISLNVGSLYAAMLRSRRYEEVIAQLWKEGMISGEMHLGTGEEAIIAGVVTQLRDGDAMALDHRGTAALLMRGVDPALILKELLGFPDGLCHGMGGHMHLMAKDHLAASSGIVGAAGPAGAGFALAAQYLTPGAVTAAFFGEGAMNQGMLMEALNLAAVWALPIIFVCKDDGWAITARSEQLTGADLNERARGLGVPAVEVDGTDVREVWNAAHAALDRARSGAGPTFLHARCVHLEAHFLGLPLLRIVRDPVGQVPAIGLPLTRSLVRSRGARWRERLAGLQVVLGRLWSTARDPRGQADHDPVARTRAALQSEPERLQAIEREVVQEIQQVLASVLTEVPA